MAVEVRADLVHEVSVHAPIHVVREFARQVSHDVRASGRDGTGSVLSHDRDAWQNSY